MTDDDIMTFAGENKGTGSEDTTDKPLVWRILITDDEKDVHSATIFALRSTKILGRRLEFLHASTAGEAMDVLKANDDVAVILLDVVMETPNAGLDLVAYIRETLGNTHSRIILRTGQPNQAPEIEVIRDYDINDYKLKSELTQNKLYASLTTAIRSYQQIKTIEASKKGLDLIVHASADLMSKKGINEFAQGVIVQLCGLLSIEPDGLICVRRNHDGNLDTVVIAAAGRYCKLIDCPLDDMQGNSEKEMLHSCLNASSNVYGKNGVALYIGSTERGDMGCYVGSTEALKDVDARLLEIFCSNISICADNLELVERLRTFAFSDPLVGLPNRHSLHERISDLVNADEAKHYQLMLLDIDNFAEINAALGQQYGDSLLCSIADRLKERFPSPAVVARVSGDAFAVLANKDIDLPEGMGSVFREQFTVDSDHQLVSVTSAIVDLGEVERDGSDALKSASVVLKIAKKQNRGEVLHYQSDMLDNAKERLGVLHDLRHAFESGDLFLAFQPKFELNDSAISGFEALLRWRNADGSITFPDSFIEIAEQSGLIVRMGEWILREAIKSIQEIHRCGWNTAHVSVNISAAQLRHPDLLSMLRRVLSESDIDPKYVDLEITESMAVADNDLNIIVLNEIKALGFSLSIDDFGTGFSSLSALQKMPIDRLKIDQSFVQTSNEKSGREIIEMIIQLGNTLDLKVIAEGVEQDSELELLKQLNCDEIQGFLYAKPMDMESLKVWMKKNHVKHNG